MPYDDKGRWVPPREEFDWGDLNNWDNWSEEDKDKLRDSIRDDLELDWRHGGREAFRTDVWGREDFSEQRRLQILEEYQSQYLAGRLDSDLAHETWGLDLNRIGVTYNSNDTWDASNMFNMLTGSSYNTVTIDMTKSELDEWNKANAHRKNLNEVIGTTEDGKSKLIERKYPVNWEGYSEDPLYRATIDEMIAKDWHVFPGGPGSDFETSRQIRGGTKEISDWVTEAYSSDTLRGLDPEQKGLRAEALFEAKKAKEISDAAKYNKRYEKGRNTQGFLTNQQNQIRQYEEWTRFDPNTGTRITLDMQNNDVIEHFTYKQVKWPTAINITGTKEAENVHEGVFYSNSYGLPDIIKSRIADEPEEIDKPNILIRNIGEATLPESISGWQQKGTPRVEENSAVISANSVAGLESRMKKLTTMKDGLDESETFSRNKLTNSINAIKGDIVWKKAGNEGPRPDIVVCRTPNFYKETTGVKGNET